MVPRAALQVRVPPRNRTFRFTCKGGCGHSVCSVRARTRVEAKRTARRNGWTFERPEGALCPSCEDMLRTWKWNEW